MGSQSFSSKPVKREFCHISIVYIILTSVFKRQLAYVCRPCWYTVCYYSVSCAVWSQEKPGCIWNGIQSDASRKSRGSLGSPTDALCWGDTRRQLLHHGTGWTHGTRHVHTEHALWHGHSCPWCPLQICPASLSCLFAQDSQKFMKITVMLGNKNHEQNYNLWALLAGLLDTSGNLFSLS